ncbi:MAG TPA: hypothetical protein PJ982_15315 [Lacipirellulaceae bacterium]|nr:hypothetical protein [Lacipirellulaceae bacterium]
MSRINGTDSPADALAKIAHLTGLFERLVAEAGQRRRLIEQRLAELAEEHADAQVLSTPQERRAA